MIKEIKKQKNIYIVAQRKGHSGFRCWYPDDFKVGIDGKTEEDVFVSKESAFTLVIRAKNECAAKDIFVKYVNRYNIINTDNVLSLEAKRIGKSDNPTDAILITNAYLPMPLPEIRIPERVGRQTSYLLHELYRIRMYLSKSCIANQTSNEVNIASVGLIDSIINIESPENIIKILLSKKASKIEFIQQKICKRILDRFGINLITGEIDKKVKSIISKKHDIAPILKRIDDQREEWLGMFMLDNIDIFLHCFAYKTFPPHIQCDDSDVKKQPIMDKSCNTSCSEYIAGVQLSVPRLKEYDTLVFDLLERTTTTAKKKLTHKVSKCNFDTTNKTQ
jgi:hypothetical protein